MQRTRQRLGLQQIKLLRSQQIPPRVGYTDDLVAANSAVAANTAKTGITTDQASAITANTAKVGYTDDLVAANSAVAANTAKTGITTDQASAITANTAKDWLHR